jgi:hypothetical protein
MTPDEKLQQMSSEELMEAALQRIFKIIDQAEIQEGRIALRGAAIQAKAIAEGALTEVRLRRAGTTMLSNKS